MAIRGRIDSGRRAPCGPRSCVRDRSTRTMFAIIKPNSTRYGNRNGTRPICARPPPTTGPSPKPAVMAAEVVTAAMRRSRRGCASVSAMAAAMVSAPLASPMQARATTNVTTPAASADSSRPAAMPASAASTTSSRPSESDRLPKHKKATSRPAM